MGRRVVKRLSVGGNRRRSPHSALRPRRVGVRDGILTLLGGDQPKTREQLQKEGRYSAASVDFHLKHLRAEGIVISTSRRPLLFTLAREGGTGPTSSRKPATVKVSRELGAALDAVDKRFGRVSRLQEKRAALKRLAATMPTPVASLLREILSDYDCLASRAL